MARYPGLQEVLDESIADFDALYEREDLNFHLAYAANIEATFTPLFGTIINHREALFGRGDPRVTALMLWHFCEEIEHRSSALIVYNQVVRNRFYRTTQFKKVLRHIGGNVAKVKEGMRRHMPDVPESAYKGAFSAIPFPARARMVMGILESQAPWRSPERGKALAYYKVWRDQYERGVDMTAVSALPPQPAFA